jgi:hypothetical protein
VDFPAAKGFTQVGLVAAMEKKWHGVMALRGWFKNEAGESAT